jgi:hypothetical protein
VTGVAVGAPLAWIRGTAGMLYALAMFEMTAVISPAFLSLLLRGQNPDGDVTLARALWCSAALAIGLTSPFACFGSLRRLSNLTSLPGRPFGPIDWPTSSVSASS